MSARRRVRVVGVGLLLPGLLFHSPAPASEPKAAKPSVKKTAPRPRSATKPQSVPARSVTPCVHVVRGGDSVSRLAVRYGVRRQALVDANRLARPEALRLGQRLTIPGCDAARPPDRPVGVFSSDATIVAARVGPRRVPTRLHLAAPDPDGRTVSFLWPVEGLVLSHFGRRGRGWHAGTDIRAEPGAPIVAAAAGTVVYSGWGRAYGRLVKIEHPDGYTTIYAHNNENLVEVGDRVVAGQVIATVGRSGRATTPHLHFEIRREGVAFNPLHLLPEPGMLMAASTGEPAGPPHEDDDE